jgi:hypothetical protein
MINEIDKILDPNEEIFWRGRPKYSAFILKAAPVVIFGLFWCSFLVPFYWALFTGQMPILALVVIIPHTLIGLGMLGGPLWASLVYPYIEYAITSKRIIVKSGFFARNFYTADYSELTDVSVNIGLLGRLTNTGDIRFTSGAGIFTEKTLHKHLSGIENPHEVFKLLKKVYFDIKTDVEYPNRLRPLANPGYQTEYKKD